MLKIYLNYSITFRLLTLFFLVFLLFSCGPRVHSNISSFGNIDALSQFNHDQNTFFILPNDKQKTSVEFSMYADSISNRLSRRGFQRVGHQEIAYFIILINYGVSGSSSKTGSIPIYGNIGGGTTYHSGTVSGGGGIGTYSGTSYTMPKWGIVGSNTYSYSVYQRYFHMKMIDKINNLAIYETKASSEGTSGTFGEVAECIFDMALKEFPYSIQKSTNISMDECGN